MQVILLEKIANLGGLGEVVKVKAGFARNFLIPKGKAQRATPENLAHFETRRGELEKLQAEALVASQSRAAALEGVMISLTRRASVDGRLFGSVTAYDIVEAMSELGHEIERSAIRMPQGPLKMIGDHDVSIALHSDVVVHIKVAVLGEAAE
ncbi:MAG: 50S ribosomal protein L9 [Gammaproteobacteria bacterium]|nr:50S ribosomal protein L9 [Gammaproteobacteria bacterium]